jgi:hypothetical protein
MKEEERGRERTKGGGWRMACSISQKREATDSSQVHVDVARETQSREEREKRLAKKP